VLDTLSGLRLDLDNPRPDQVNVLDIAGGLAKVCRFGAQATGFYSVAQHALLVCQLVEEELGRPDLAAWALHHDSAEAYVCDLPRPLKLKLRQDEESSAYDRLSDALDRAIAERFGVCPPAKGSDDKTIIDTADDLAILIEATILLPNGTAGIETKTEVSRQQRASLHRLGELLSPAEAEKTFLAAHARLLAPVKALPAR
jgi:hypothetical protein